MYKVILLSARDGSWRPYGPTAVTDCTPGLLICSGLAGERQKETQCCPHTQPPAGLLVLEEGVSLLPSCQRGTVEKSAGGYNGRDTTCELGEVYQSPSPSETCHNLCCPWRGDTAVAAGVGQPLGSHHQCPAGSSTAVSTRHGAMKAHRCHFPSHSLCIQNYIDFRKE